MSKKARILVVDDERAMREAMRDWLSEDGYEVGMAEGGKEALDAVHGSPWDVILLDLKMPGMDGMEVLRGIKALETDAEVIMMTAYATVDTAVQAMKEGAFDYLVKPFDPDELEIQIKKILAHKELVLENIFLKQRIEERFDFDEIVGKSEPMRRVFELITRVAPTDSTVLVTGESGTGKELVARAIHANSPRCYGPFVATNCGALPDSLLESELFGYEKGAFTGAEHTRKGRFEIANGGTLFLDEIGDISLKTQVDLLRVIQEKEFRRLGGEQTMKLDVRIVAATNRDLEQAIKENLFRRDLFYRLNVISITLPPLRERKEDIPLLIRRFIGKYALELNRAEVKVSPAALRRLVSYDWPGNVRELENVIERAMVIGKSGEILPGDLPFPEGPTEPGPLPKSLKAMERLHIERALKEHDWNVSKAARDLGIDRQTLYNKIQRYGIARK